MFVWESNSVVETLPPLSPELETVALMRSTRCAFGFSSKHPTVRGPDCWIFSTPSQLELIFFFGILLSCIVANSVASVAAFLSWVISATSSAFYFSSSSFASSCFLIRADTVFLIFLSLPFTSPSLPFDFFLLGRRQRSSSYWSLVSALHSFGE